LFGLSFEKNKNSEPIVGNKINDERIGKFIFYFTINKVNKAEKPNNITNAY